MIYTELTMKALRAACAAHAGQLDKGDIPYIFHPYHLAERMDTEISCAAALLHDVIEDTDMTMEQLRAEFPREVADVVALLTHESGVDYFDYVLALKRDPVARKIKLADLEHNSDEARMAVSGVPQEKRKRLMEKYDRAKRLLME